MANKLVAVFLMCVVVVAAVHLSPVAADEKASAIWKDCFKHCEKDCLHAGTGYTNCEMKCDSECDAREIAGNYNIYYVYSTIIHKN